MGLSCKTRVATCPPRPPQTMGPGPGSEFCPSALSEPLPTCPQTRGFPVPEGDLLLPMLLLHRRPALLIGGSDTPGHLCFLRPQASAPFLCFSCHLLALLPPVTTCLTGWPLPCPPSSCPAAGLGPHLPWVKGYEAFCSAPRSELPMVLSRAHF